MPINKAVLAAFKAATRLRPDIKEFYKAQRVAEDLSARLAIPNPRCRIDDITAPMPDGCALPLRVFTPLDIDFSLAEGFKVTEDFRGTVLFFHGGGWVNGDVDFYTDACSTMALRLERRVVSVDYRLAPEHRFPAAPEDCYLAAREIFSQCHLFGITPDDITLIGDSAGGNLAAVVSLMARDRGEFMPRQQILLYPATNNDHTENSPFESVRTNGTDYLLTSKRMVDYMKLYRSGDDDLQNPYYAPLVSKDLSRQPRTLIITAEYDPLRDEGEAYGIKLAQAGNDVEIHRIHDALHGFMSLSPGFKPVKKTYQYINAFLSGKEGGFGQVLSETFGDTRGQSGDSPNPDQNTSD